MNQTGELLLSIQASWIQNNIETKGEVRLLQVQQPEPLSFLSLGELSFPLVPSITSVSAQRQSVFLTNGKDSIEVRGGEKQDMDILVDMVQTLVGPSLKSQLAFVGSDGVVLGVVDGQFAEEPALASQAQASSVVVDQKPDGSLAATVGSLIVGGSSLIATGIVYGTDLLSQGLRFGSEMFVRNTAPVQKPMVVAPSTQKNAELALKYSKKAVQISNATVSAVVSSASKFGQSLSKSLGYDDPNKRQKSTTFKLVQSAAIAVDRIGDSIDYSVKTITADASQVTSDVVRHKYGDQASQLADTSLGVMKNATLVYIDARGISRKAIIKTIGKSAIKYKLTDGRKVTMMPQDDGSLKITDVSKQ